MKTEKCCQGTCSANADYRIEWGAIANPDNYSLACEFHVGALLGYHVGQPAPDSYRVYPLSGEVTPAKVNHCVDCCCAQSWAALDITKSDGKSIPEHIRKLRKDYLSYVETAASNSADARHYRALYLQALAELKK